MCQIFKGAVDDLADFFLVFRLTRPKGVVEDAGLADFAKQRQRQFVGYQDDADIAIAALE